jgi:branched-chain amino acid aminotransferase
MAGVGDVEAAGSAAAGTPADARAGEVYVSGRFVPADQPAIGVGDRGFLLGDGVFETVRVEGGVVRDAAAHLARLRIGLALLDLADAPCDEALLAAVIETARRNRLDPAVVRVTVTRGAAATRGLLPPALPAAPTVVVQAFPLSPAPPGGGPAAIVAVLASTTRRNEHSPLSRIKSTNYLDMILARIEAARRGADDALVLNTAGRLACATTANVFVVKGDRLLTPPTAEGALPGITRARLLAGAAALGLGAEERPLPVEAAVEADELLLTNTVVPVRAVVRLDGRPVGRGEPGPVAARIAAWL